MSTEDVFDITTDAASYAEALKNLLRRHDWFVYASSNVPWGHHLKILSEHPEIVAYWSDADLIDDCFFMLYHGGLPYELIRKIMASDERYIRFLENVTARLIP